MKDRIRKIKVFFQLCWIDIKFTLLKYLVITYNFLEEHLDKK